MLKHLDEAFKLLEEAEELDFDVDYVPEEVVDEDEIDIEEMPDEEEFEEEPEEGSVEARLDNLEADVAEIKNAVIGEEDVELDDFDSSVKGTESYEDKFNEGVYNSFVHYSKIPKDKEITEELLDKRPYCDAYIPSTALANRITNEEVKKILLNRTKKGTGNEIESK